MFPHHLRTSHSTELGRTRSHSGRTRLAGCSAGFQTKPKYLQPDNAAYQKWFVFVLRCKTSQRCYQVFRNWITFLAAQSWHASASFWKMVEQKFAAMISHNFRTGFHALTVCFRTDFPSKVFENSEDFPTADSGKTVSDQKRISRDYSTSSCRSWFFHKELHGISTLHQEKKYFPHIPQTKAFCQEIPAEWFSTKYDQRYFRKVHECRHSCGPDSGQTHSLRHPTLDLCSKYFSDLFLKSVQK